MTDVLFDDIPAEPTSGPGPAAVPALDRPAALAVGDRFEFRGLPGQQPDERRTLGSGAVGWSIEITGISIDGAVGMRCVPPSGDADAAQVTSARLGEVLALIGHSIWHPVS